MISKNIFKLACVAFLGFAGGAFAQAAAGWAPGLTEDPAPIKWVRYDITGAYGKISVRMVGSTVDYYYDWVYTDANAIARANAFYSALLGAKASGAGIYLWHTDATSTRIQIIQIGKN